MFGNAFIAILGAVLWVVLALWPAMIAKRKGYSFMLFLLLSIIFSWLLILIVVLVLRDKNQSAQSRADDAAAEKALRREEGR